MDAVLETCSYTETMYTADWKWIHFVCKRYPSGLSFGSMHLFFCHGERGNYKSGTFDSTGRWSYYTYAVSAKKSISWESPLVLVLVVLVVAVVVIVVVVLLLLLLLLFLLLVALIAFVDILRWNCRTHNHKLFSSLNFKLNSL